MTSEAEKEFRKAERQLDELLREEEAVLAAHGITITDDSDRAYHYKNAYLSWRYRFETRRTSGSNVEKVWVSVSLYEQNTETLKIWRRAELFQVGQQSRWQDTTEELLPLAEAARRGLSSIVLEAIGEGANAAADAA
jgi:shikimate kinase